MEGSKGLFVSMPSYKAGNGEYKDICFPCTKEARIEFDKAVIGAYQQVLTQGQVAAQKQESSGQQEQTSSRPFQTDQHFPGFVPACVDFCRCFHVRSPLVSVLYSDVEARPGVSTGRAGE